MKKHDWPGNVRQLHNVLVQAAVLAEGQVLDRSDLVAALGEMALGTHPNDPSFYRPLDEQFEPEEYLNTLRRNYLRRAMEQARGVKSQAARLLGMKSYQTLDAQLKRLQVSGEWDP